MSLLSIRSEIPTAIHTPVPEDFVVEAIGELLDPIDVGDLDEGAAPMWKLAIVEAQMIVDDQRRGAVSTDAAIASLLVVLRRALNVAMLEDCVKIPLRS